MNFYQLIEQQYKDYKSPIFTLHNRCDTCPCKTLRNKVFAHKSREKCRDEMEHLANKYNIHDFDVYLCGECRFVSVKIAKKLFKSFNRI